MNVKKALDILMGQLGNRTASGLRAACLDEMALAQEKLEQAPELPWFLEVEEATAETEPGEERIPLPTDFIREVEDFNLSLLDEDGNLEDLAKRTYDQAEVEVSRNADPGIPSIYYIRNGNIILRPVPDGFYFVRFPTYYGKQEAPQDNDTSENEWFKTVPDLMIAMAGVQVAGKRLKDPDLVALFNGDQKSAEDRLARLIIAKQEENRERNMG